MLPCDLFLTTYNLKWYPRQESNLNLSLRRTLFYPLNYGDGRLLSPCYGGIKVGLVDQDSRL